MMKLPTESTMWRAFAAKDSQFDGVFVVAVRTTGIFCRPTCRARLPRRENVEFFASAAVAERAGYRACKLCRPAESAGRMPAVVARLTELARSRGDGAMIRGAELAEMGIDPSTARRQFRRRLGVTFAGYQRGLRMGTALAAVRRGAAVIEAQGAAGFESGSGFRAAFAKWFGGPASRGTGAVMMRADWFESPLGAMVAVASDEGLVLLDWVDRAGLPRAIERVRDGGAVITPGTHRYLEMARAELVAYFAGRFRAFTVPVAPVCGSTFERAAWAYLRTIPFGQTRNYGEQARGMGRPNGARAVGRANGMNYCEIVVPCHRVVAAGGALTGYGGGLWRKRWLLEHERRVAGVEHEPSLFAGGGGRR